MAWEMAESLTVRPRRLPWGGGRPLLPSSVDRFTVDWLVRIAVYPVGGEHDDLDGPVDGR